MSWDEAEESKRIHPLGCHCEKCERLGKLILSEAFMNEVPEFVTYVDAIKIAKIVHNIVMAYSTAISRSTQPPWNSLSSEDQERIVDGVRFVIAKPDSTPSEVHDNWVWYMKGHGWTYGKTKDLAKKTHPSIQDWLQLSKEERAVDYLFLTIVNSWMGR